MLRGRPREFDPDDALDCIMRVFWAKGFAATSLEDLTAATGLNRPSLYAAFGNKAATFKAALERFMRVHVAAEIAALTNPGSEPQAALTASIGLTRKRLSRTDAPHGCMVAQAVADAPTLEPEIQEAVAQIIAQMEQAFYARNRDSAKARLAVATIVGLGALARIQRNPAFLADAFDALTDTLSS